ncbi:TetR family transcriptional regulator [Caballeronia fortuita]|uniref:TetR family transcriptional regulator n=1 Tax=Caballeronia fortuita TaxID=1777138 RepID=A0A158A440_9BURK|nr:helix-turn-helix domain-containing protein [Caballeronia fortuita]SAK52614.1 TetR family transcriptional regulator [Caballeronia fortuita]
MKGASSKRKRLGRPTGNIDQRESILDAAGVDLSQRGHAGTSLKEVAVSCGVTQALITYHFGTKQQLFEQVFLRRAMLISEERVPAMHLTGRVPDSSLLPVDAVN